MERITAAMLKTETRKRAKRFAKLDKKHGTKSQVCIDRNEMLINEMLKLNIVAIINSFLSASALLRNHKLTAAELCEAFFFDTVL